MRDFGQKLNRMWVEYVPKEGSGRNLFLRYASSELGHSFQS